MSYLAHRRKAFRGAPPPLPAHWWDLTDLTSGLLDLGTGGWGHLQNGSSAGAYGGVTTTSDQPDGAGDSLDFSGASDVNLRNMGAADIAWDGVGNDITISFWAKVDAWVNAEQFFYWSKAGAKIAIIDIRTATSNHILHTQYDTDEDFIQAGDPSQSASTATWYHVIAQYDRDAQTNTLWVNNTFIDSTTDATNMGDLETAASQFAIGGSTPFNGKLFSLQIFDGLLDADQRSTLYNSGNGGTYSDFYGTPSFGTNPTSTNLWGWWSLSDTSDEAGTFDDMTNNNTATFTSGYNGNALTLNGTNQYLSLTDAQATSYPTGAQSWACFFKPDAVEDGALISKLVGGSYTFQLTTKPGNDVQILISGTGADTFTATATDSYSIGSWVHVAAVYTPSTSLKIYIDGIEKDSNTTSIPSSLFDSTAEFQIGAREFNGSEIYFDGQIDDACVFNKALSADEVKWLVHNSYADL